MNWLLARLILGHICLHACMAGLRMAAPLLALTQGYSPLAVGVLMSLFALTQVFLALPAGRYADRHGLRRPVGLGVMAAVSGTLLAAVFPVFPVLCLAALCAGGATGAASIALQRQVGRSARGAAELKRMFSWLSIGPAFSNFLGPLLAGLLIDHAGVWFGGQPGDLQGYRAAFLFAALLPLVTWLCVRRAPQRRAAAAPAAGTRKAWDLLREPMMRRLMLVNWLLSACWDVHTFVMPVLGHERGFSASTIGTLLGAFAISAAAVRMLMPWVASRLREWVVIGGAMLVTAVLFVVYPFMPGAWSMGLCSVLLGLVLGSVQPLIMSTLHQITPHDRHGEALGLRLLTLNASSVAMPLMFGSVGAVVGVSLVFWTVGAAVGWGSRAAWGLKP
ncbi:MFS transporter [Hylemonella gracilis str. Niagara R]|uniref:MFS transporter n=1 Tax=Hylemonella gracilis str. Niagara R TaxID=1458275 RepID=A0A016XIZ9_9BURK|nr:MFS transporter [Hylemonella gracilis]EYC51193.1 MFS transporter [Hylemonella gracilis str. Niagara R]